MTTKAYASAYQSDRVCPAAMARGEVRVFSADFNGALNGETITAATWQDYRQAVVTLSGLTQSAGVVSVTVTADLPGYADMRCEVTTSAGRKLVQWFCVEVKGCMATGTGLTWTAA